MFWESHLTHTSGFDWTEIISTFSFTGTEKKNLLKISHSVLDHWVLTSLMHHKSLKDGKFENGVILISPALR